MLVACVLAQADGDVDDDDEAPALHAPSRFRINPPLQWQPLQLACAPVSATPPADLCSLATAPWVLCDYGTADGGRAFDAGVRLCERCPAKNWVLPCRKLVDTVLRAANARHPERLLYRDKELLR